MNVVLYGKSEGVFDTEEWLNSITGNKKISVFKAFGPAQKYLAQYDVDMIFIDADDDITDWQYFTQKIREINSRTKIVLLSSDTGQSVRAYEAGLFDYLLKPVKKKQLERVVAKAGYK